MERDPFMYGPMVMEDLMMTVQLMAMPLVYTLFLLGPLVMMEHPLFMMSHALLN